MLRASSLGLRCYRHTLHPGALRCSTQLSLAPRKSHRGAAQATPNAPEDRWAERLAREPESVGWDVPEGEYGDEGNRAEGANRAPHAIPHPQPTSARAESTRESEPVPDTHPRLVTPMSTQLAPERVSVTRKHAQELEAESLARARFEKNIPTYTSMHPRQEALPRSMQIRPRLTRAVRERMPLDPLNEDRFYTPVEDKHRETRAELLAVLATSQDPEAAWNAYSALMALPRFQDRLLIPWQHLHRFSRLIASVRPRTRVYFSRLLSVLYTIHRTGGTVHLWQWNVLVDFAGKGWRKTTPENFRAALDVYHDLVSNKAPGASFSKTPDNPGASEGDFVKALLEPDIWTLTTLLNIAISTFERRSVRHAAALLENSGQQPTAVTYLSYIRYYTKLNRLIGVRSVLAQMVSNNMELGLDGTNACIWAFGRNNRVDIAEKIYQVLRSNMSEEPNPHAEKLRDQLAKDNIYVARNLVPDHITYTCLVQIYAYRGHFTECLAVFMDMIHALDSPDAETPGTDHDRARLYLPVYRAIFIGFVHHGNTPRVAHSTAAFASGTQTLTSSMLSADPTAWSLGALESLFTEFLGIPHGTKPTENLFYWILTAFAKTSGEDKHKLREVFERLEARFHRRWWGGRMRKLRKAVFEPGKFSPEELTWGDAEAALEDVDGDSTD